MSWELCIYSLHLQPQKKIKTNFLPSLDLPSLTPVCQNFLPSLSLPKSKKKSKKNRESSGHVSRPQKHSLGLPSPTPVWAKKFFCQPTHQNAAFLSLHPSTRCVFPAERTKKCSVGQTALQVCPERKCACNGTCQKRNSGAHVFPLFQWPQMLLRKKIKKIKKKQS